MGFHRIYIFYPLEPRVLLVTSFFCRQQHLLLLSLISNLLLKQPISKVPSHTLFSPEKLELSSPLIVDRQEE